MERLECMSWEGGEMAVGALLRTWGAGGGCKPEMQLFGFFSRARSAGTWWVGGVYCWGFWGGGGGGRAKRGF